MMVHNYSYNNFLQITVVLLQLCFTNSVPRRDLYTNKVMMLTKCGAMLTLEGPSVFGRSCFPTGSVCGWTVTKDKTPKDIVTAHHFLVLKKGGSFAISAAEFSFLIHNKTVLLIGPDRYMPCLSPTCEPIITT